MGEQLNLFCQRLRFDFQFVEFSQHQFFRLIAARFFLTLAQDNIAQHLIFFGQLGCLLGRIADQFDLFELLAGFIQLRSQLGDSGFVSLILFLAGGELRLKVGDLFLYVGEFFFLLRFVGADFPDCFLGVSKLLFQI